jgi:hypothetical protein
MRRFALILAGRARQWDERPSRHPHPTRRRRARLGLRTLNKQNQTCTTNQIRQAKADPH